MPIINQLNKKKTLMGAKKRYDFMFILEKAANRAFGSCSAHAVKYSCGTETDLLRLTNQLDRQVNFCFP